MKIKIFLNIILIITFACNKSSKNDKNKILNVETENCAHIENKDIYPPNPPFNFQIAEEKIELKNTKPKFRINYKTNCRSKYRLQRTKSTKLCNQN